MVSKQDMKVDSDYFINSLMYMASWTSVLEETNFFVKNKIMHPSVTYKYIDVGCGKGKAVLVARKNKIVGGDRNNYVGIDFENNLVSIAKKNSLKVFGDEGNFIFADVAYFDFNAVGENLIFFLYNPFDEEVMNKMLMSINGSHIILVYVNPLNRNLLAKYGFTSRLKRDGWHSNLSYEVFELKQDSSTIVDRRKNG
jgi:SAM-dependent methyltransferase